MVLKEKLPTYSFCVVRKMNHSTDNCINSSCNKIPILDLGINPFKGTYTLLKVTNGARQPNVKLSFKSISCTG